MRSSAISAFLLLFAVQSVGATEQDSALLRTFVDSGVLSDLRWPNFSTHQATIAKFYTSRAYSLAWTRNGAPTTQAESVIGLLKEAWTKGLDAEDYDASRWSTRLSRIHTSSPPLKGEELARFDLALTVALVRFVSDLHAGRVNPQLFCFGLDTEQKRCDLATLIESVLNSSNVRAAIQELEPPFEAYRRTEQALQTYTRLAQEDDGEVLPIPKNPIKPGDSYAGSPRLDRVLRLLGDLPATAQASAVSQTYSGPLVDAVKHFQTRHGLDPDGRIGQATFTQLNMPLSFRVRQLRLVLERWRWLPDSFVRPPIIVNIPEFRLYAFNDRYDPEIQMKIVVGGAYRRQTPVFSNQMTHVIFRPYWNVPLSIQRNELVPKIKNNPAYLRDNDYQVVDARSGGAVSAEGTPDLIAQLRSGRLAIRQLPGPKNALGLMKFMFPNEYNVYLHGTPAQALFGKSRRDFSHGCIRVEEPEQLALWVLKQKPEWDLDRIRAAENGAKPLQVNLDHPIPVLVLYGTAIVRENGDVYFFDDIYGHDAALAQLLEHGYPYSDWKPTNAVCDRRPRE